MTSVGCSLLAPQNSETEMSDQENENNSNLSISGIRKLFSHYLGSQVTEQNFVNRPNSNYQNYKQNHEGMSFDRGFTSPSFVTQTKDKHSVEYENALVLIYERKISEISPVIPALN